MIRYAPFSHIKSAIAWNMKMKESAIAEYEKRERSAN